MVLARELTKLHEDVWRGTLLQAVEHLDQQAPRGEYVVVLQGAPSLPAATDDQIVLALQHSLQNGATKKDAVATVTSVTGASKRRVYDLALGIAR